jgi:hypothetical protein
MRQVDGLIVALFGRQARVDRDALGDPGNAVAAAFGMEPYDCVSSIFGIYLHELDVAWVSVATVAAFRGCGVFLVPIAFGSEPFLVPAAGATPVPWFDYLLSKSVLELHVPRSCLRGRAATSGTGDVMFVVAQFGVNGRIHLGTNQRRPERVFHLVSEGRRPMHLPVHPELLPRPSPLAGSLAPTAANDTAPASPLFESPADTRIPSPRWTKWNVAHIAEITLPFPYPELRSMALAIMDGSYNSFVGDPRKAVFMPDRHRFNPEKTRLLIAKLNEAVAASAMWGPLPYCPFPFARPYPPGLVKKNKYEPLCTEVRLTSDMGAGGAESVNELDVNPHLISTHFSVSSFVNVALSFGVGLVIAEDDVQDAFKMNPINPDLMHTVVTMVETTEGPAFYGDLAHNFGHVASEYGWQAEISLVEWLARQEPNMESLFIYVDNDWQFFPLGANVPERVAATDSFFESLGMTRNKKRIGSTGSVLGWQFDVAGRSPMGRCVLQITVRKLECYRDRIFGLQSKRTITLKEAEWAAGTMCWLAEVIPGSCAYVAPLYRCKAKLESRLRSRPACTKTTIHIDQSPEVRESLLFWMRFVRDWKGAVPMVIGFGPFRLPDVRGWVDTSGEHMRAGGLLFIPSSKLLLAFSKELSANDKEAAQGPKSIVSATIELQGIRIWARTFFQDFCSRKTSLIETDSESASQALARGHSGNTGMLSAVRDSNMLACRFSANYRVRFTPRSFATLQCVDALSRGDSDAAQCIAVKVFGKRFSWAR